MMIISQLTSLIKYKKVKTENHFFEMLTATVSHDMRTPLNAINGLASNLEPFLKDEQGKILLKIV